MKKPVGDLKPAIKMVEGVKKGTKVTVNRKGIGNKKC